MLEIPGALFERIRAHAAAAYPREACGVLVGTDGDCRRVSEVHPAANLKAEARSDRFEIDALWADRLDRAARARGLMVVGYYHSHPDHPARPSPTDAEFGQGSPDRSFLILSVSAREVRATHSWLWREFGNPAFEEEQVEIQAP
ncbi:MAG: M67 family metallopeptidase [Planctomycetes bacterium]|nr:M67 family metallopeptidase [Planctomycetota bacterium]